jgi:hypothetical protein
MKNTTLFRTIEMGQSLREGYYIIKFSSISGCQKQRFPQCSWRSVISICKGVDTFIRAQLTEINDETVMSMMLCCT